MTKAFLAVEGAQAEGSNRIHQSVDSLSDQVMTALIRHLPDDGVMHIEHIQDQVELALMRNGDHQVARANVLYRAEQAKKRQKESNKTDTKPNGETRQIIQPDGSKQTFDLDKARVTLLAATADIKDVHVEAILKHVLSNIYNGMSLNDLNQVMVLAARGLIDQEPNYSQVAARLLLNNLEIEALNFVHGNSQGVIPFLKVANDTAVEVNQGGKRKGAFCAYLEIWHIDIEDFLDLRKNTGDERRRTHDMNTANWIPDLFMQRVAEDQEWTLFSPDETPDLHDLYGKKFKRTYEIYEQKADEGSIKLFRRVKAVELWRKMIGMLFETGHPWVTFPFHRQSTCTTT